MNHQQSKNKIEKAFYLTHRYGLKLNSIQETNQPKLTTHYSIYRNNKLRFSLQKQNLDYKIYALSKIPVKNQQQQQTDRIVDNERYIMNEFKKRKNRVSKSKHNSTARTKQSFRLITQNPYMDTRSKKYILERIYANVKGFGKKPQHQVSLKTIDYNKKVQKSCDSIQKNFTIKDEIQNKLELMWISREIPGCHRKYLRQLLEQIDSGKIKLMQTQIAKLKSIDECNIIYVMKSIKARESCLQQIKVLINQIKSLQKQKNKLRYQKIINLITELLHDLRTLTVNIVEDALRWKQQIKSLYKKYLNNPSKQITFTIFSNQNYLMKIVYDTLFMKESKLFSQSSYPDPFFISYNLGYQNDKQFFKIRASELLLLQESLINITPPNN